MVCGSALSFCSAHLAKLFALYESYYYYDHFAKVFFLRGLLFGSATHSLGCF